MEFTSIDVTKETQVLFDVEAIKLGELDMNGLKPNEKIIPVNL